MYIFLLPAVCLSVIRDLFALAPIIYMYTYCKNTTTTKRVSIRSSQSYTVSQSLYINREFPTIRIGKVRSAFSNY